MNLTQRMPIPVPISMPVFPRGNALRRLILVLPAALVLLALPRPAAATSIQVELPGVSVQADEESDKVEVRVPGVLVYVHEPQEPAPPTGPSIDLSGTWKFKEDLEEKGHLTGWRDPDFDDSTWRTIQVPASWEEQGVLTLNPKWTGDESRDFYNGYGWYRRHFAVPADWAGATVMLRFGAIDDWDWTYVNGQLVGTTTGEGTWDDPRDYAIPSYALYPGEDNVIAVRVGDMGGSGGIVAPPVELVNTSVAPAVAHRVYSRTLSDIVRFGGDVTVDADEKVSGDVVVLGGSANINGYVTGDVVAMGGTVRLRPGSRVDGDVVVVGGSLDRADGAAIGGDVVSAVPGVHWPRGIFAHKDSLPWKLTGIAGAILGLIALGFIALLAVLIMKDRLAVMAEALPGHPARAALYGLVGFALTPAALLTAVIASAFASVILAITIVGIPLIPAVFAALLALIAAGGLLVVAGVVAVWFSLGKATFSLFGRPSIHPIWAVLIGVTLIAIASHIPVLGPLVAVTVIIFGFGLAIMTGLGADPQWAHRRLGFRTPETVPSAPPTVPPAVPPVPPSVPLEAAETADSADRAAPEPEQGPDQEPPEGPQEDPGEEPRPES